MGSSPRVRGAVSTDSAMLDGYGIIPARAGSRDAPGWSSCRTRDHPRACGEQNFRQRSLHMPRGSSPRVRGAAAQVPDAHVGDGIIPARAGSSRGIDIALGLGQDHPRACGEQSIGWYAASIWSGSSPRVRGAEDRERCRGGCRGIIPARAGSSSSRILIPGLRWDHPRACGEQT